MFIYCLFLQFFSCNLFKRFNKKNVIFALQLLAPLVLFALIALDFFITKLKKQLKTNSINAHAKVNENFVFEEATEEIAKLQKSCENIVFWSKIFVFLEALFLVLLSILNFLQFFLQFLKTKKHNHPMIQKLFMFACITFLFLASIVFLKQEIKCIILEPKSVNEVLINRINNCAPNSNEFKEKVLSFFDYLEKDSLDYKFSLQFLFGTTIMHLMLSYLMTNSI